MDRVQLEKLAFFDELTGLRTRNALLADYEGKSLDNKHFIYVYIDKFIKMNSVFGTDTVDDILRIVGNTLKDYCGKSEVYRISAGHFVLVTESHFICEPEELQRILIQPVQLDDLQFILNASICVLGHDEFKDRTIQDVLKIMQLTLSIEKQKSSNMIVYATEENLKKYNEKIEVTNNIKRGVKAKEFYPKFQPFVDTHTNEIIGFETVSRWDLNGVMLRPKCFLEVAEWTGLIYELELHIFEEALKFFRELKDDKSIKIGPRFKVTVDFSAYTLKIVDVQLLLELLMKYNIAPHDIIIETHERYMTDEKAYEKIIELRDNRFMILLDDYTSGNSSLSFLADLKIDAIKLSEDLLHDLDDDQEFQRLSSIYKFMVDIATKLNVAVVSDGVDTPQNAKLVQELGVQIGQGKHYSRALLKDEFIEYYKNNKKKRLR